MTFSSKPLLHFDFSLKNSQKTLIHCANGTLNAGDRILLLGKSGSGKSLLLSALACLIPICGTLSFKGISHKTIKKDEWRSHISLIHQNPYFNTGTVLENLKLPFTFSYHKHKCFNKEWHIHYLSYFDKGVDFLDKDIIQLSGGEKQLVNFLRTLQLSPTILLLDEPTAALDEENTKKLIDIFLNYQYNNPNTSCLWISHNPAHQSILQASVWTMQDGNLFT